MPAGKPGAIKVFYNGKPLAKAKLGNADFVARAPEDVVEGEREKREEAETRRLKIDEALARLKGAA